MSHKVEVTVPEAATIRSILKHPFLVAVLSPALVWGTWQIWQLNTIDSEIKPKVEILVDSVFELSKDRKQVQIDGAKKSIIELNAIIGEDQPTAAQRELRLLYEDQQTLAERELEELKLSNKVMKNVD